MRKLPDSIPSLTSWPILETRSNSRPPSPTFLYTRPKCGKLFLAHVASSFWREWRSHVADLLEINASLSRRFWKCLHDEFCLHKVITKSYKRRKAYSPLWCLYSSFELVTLNIQPFNRYATCIMLIRAKSCLYIEFTS